MCYKKYRVGVWVFLLLQGLLFVAQVFASTPQELLHYHDSGEYAKELAAVGREARCYLDKRVKDISRYPSPAACGVDLSHKWEREKCWRGEKRLAIVLDIDETSLSNWSIIYRTDFTFPFSDLKNVLKKCHFSNTQETVIPSTFALYQDAIKKGVAVFFITARAQSLEARTIQDLHQAGYKQWTGLLLKPNNKYYSSNSIFKTKARKKITENGYDIILNMGDQDSDLKGGYADKIFKLPNPYYYLP